MPCPRKEPEEFRDPLQNYDPKIYKDPLEKALAEETVVAIQCTPVATGRPRHAGSRGRQDAGGAASCVFARRTRRAPGRRVFRPRRAWIEWLSSTSR